MWTCLTYGRSASFPNSKQGNDNLEQQAQALFRSWFVDFEPFGGVMPKEWKKKNLAEIASFIGGYSYKGEELVNSSNIGMVSIKNFNRHGGFKDDGYKDVMPSTKIKNAQYAQLFDILVAHTDLTQNAEVIGNAELLLSMGKYNKVCFSMDLVKVLPSNEFPYKFLLGAILKDKTFKGHCLGYINGTTVLHLSKKALPEYTVTIPTEKEAKRMNDVFFSYYSRMANIIQENDRLKQLRDTLLPRLMSGELKVMK